jgi:hypothetical protein
MGFESNFLAALQDSNVKGKRLFAFLSERRGLVRQRMMRTAQLHAVDHLGSAALSDRFDWSNVDWASLLKIILPILAAIFGL